MKQSKTGFTLIELLIVVAIIGILAAIAVPNFLNAQMRAKIARAQSDMRSVSTAIEQLRLDRGVLLIDFWDDDLDWGIKRMKNVFGGVGGAAQNDRGGTAGIFAPLTSPVSYLSAVPVDTFLDKSRKADTKSQLISQDLVPPYCYMYSDNDPEGQGYEGIAQFNPTDNAAKQALERVGMKPLSEGQYVLIGAGPDGYRGSYSSNFGMGFPYDSSNGLTSHGDIVRIQ